MFPFKLQHAPFFPQRLFPLQLRKLRLPSSSDDARAFLKRPAVARG